MNHAVNDGSVYLLSTLFPVIQSLFDLTYAQIGILIGTGYFVPVVCQPIIGHYGEQRKPARFLGFGILLIAISVFSITYSTTFASLLVSFLILRIGSSFFHPIGISAISRTYAGPSLQTSMGFQSAFGNMGVLLVFLTVSPIYLLVGWNFTFVLFAVVALATVIITLILLEKDNSIITPQSHVLNESRARFQFLRFLLFFLTIAAVSGGSYAVILNFANLFLTQYQPQLSLTQVNLLVSSFILAAFLGAISTRFWTRKVGPTISLAVSYIVSSVAIFIFAFFPRNVEVSSIALITCGFMLSASYPLTYTLLSDQLRGTRHGAGSSFGSLSSAQTIGASVLGLMSGLMVPVLGINAPFLLVATLMVLGVILSLARIKRHHMTTIDKAVEPVVALDPAQE